MLGIDLPWLDEIVVAKDRRRLPVVLTLAAVRALLNELNGTIHLLAALLYGTGMCVLEGLRLRVEVVEFARCELVIRQGKGGKDRVTVLPENLIVPLRPRIARAKALQCSNLDGGFGAVSIAGLVSRMASASWYAKAMNTAPSGVPQSARAASVTSPRHERTVIRAPGAIVGAGRSPGLGFAPGRGSISSSTTVRRDIASPCQWSSRRPAIPRKRPRSDQPCARLRSGTLNRRRGHGPAAPAHRGALPQRRVPTPERRISIRCSFAIALALQAIVGRGPGARCADSTRRPLRAPWPTTQCASGGRQSRRRVDEAMAMIRWATGWLVALLAIAAAPALGEVYKWVDETGKVNYGDKPPPGRARPLDADSARVSVVQGMPADEIERLRRRSEQQQLQALERELEALRARERLLASAAPPAEYVEVVVPAYVHPWPWRHHPRFGHPQRRPDHPAHRPGPSSRGRPLPGH